MADQPAALSVASMAERSAVARAGSVVDGLVDWMVAWTVNAMEQVLAATSAVAWVVLTDVERVVMLAATKAEAMVGLWVVELAVMWVASLVVSKVDEMVGTSVGMTAEMSAC